MRKGSTHTEESRAKIGAAQRGKTLSPEHRAAIGQGIRASGNGRCKVGCTCKRHERDNPKCKPGCTCKKHLNGGWNHKFGHVTKPEIAVQHKLRERGVKFRAHKRVVLDGHCFFPDIYIPDFDMVVEVYGCYWHNCPVCFEKVQRPEMIERDRLRERLLREHFAGFFVVWAHDIEVRA